MEEWHWISLGVILFGYLLGIVGIYIKNQVRMKEMEVRLMELTSSFKLHERLNEKAFDKFEKKIDDVYSAINEVKTFLMGKK